MNNLKKIFFVLLCVLPFIYFPKEVHGAEPVTITISGNVATAKLTGKPDAFAVQSKIYDLLINQKNVTKLIVDGEFGEDNAAGMARQLSYTNISELEVKNSNYLPSQFYRAGANGQPGKLTSYKDDGTVKELRIDSLSTSSNYKDPNRLIYFESPSAEKIYNGVFDGFRGEELIVPQIKESAGVGSESYNNFEQMPNVKKINLSGLEELTGYGLFTEMPNLTSLDLSNVKSLTSMNFLNNNNTSPTYVNLSNLITLNEKYSVGSKTSTNPVYIKLGNSHPEKLFNENTNAIFYKSISPKLNFEVEKGTDIKVSSIGDSSFLSYNTNDCKVIWYIDNALSQYAGTDINLETDNLSEGVHSLTPVISYKGKEDRGFFGDLIINVNVYEKKLTAEPASQTTSLGIDTSKFDYSKFVKNVKLGDQVLSSDQYKVELINSLTTDTVGTKNAKIKITLKSDASKTVDLDVPVEVSWGNTILAKDETLSKVIASVTVLNVNNKPKLYSNKGNGLNGQVTSRPILEIYDTDLMKSVYTVSYGTVNQSTDELMNSWNQNFSSINNAIQYGNVLSFTVWKFGNSNSNYNGSNTWVSRNEQLVKETEGYQKAYYELTSNGLVLLHVNQLTPKVGKVPIYSAKQYLDEHITDYIDLKGYSNISVKGFSEYPKTTSSGEKKAKILVEETLTTGKKVQYEYEVTINVEPGTLTYTVPKTLTFKEFSKSKSEQIVQRKYSGSLGLLIKDNRGSNKQGNWTLTAKASSDLKGIAPYLIYRNEKGVDSYLNGSAVPVYTQDKQVSATEPLEVEVSNKWKSTDGILLKVPSKNNLASQEYSTTITWNLVEGP
ncbi:hypothetical protein LT312_002707 [Enterococcus faecalis]|nr:hypothetical protein [Enterococcus faecalis]